MCLSACLSFFYKYLLTGYPRPDNLLKADDIKVSKIRLLIEPIQKCACVLVQAAYKEQNVFLPVLREAKIKVPVECLASWFIDSFFSLCPLTEVGVMEHSGPVS